MYRAPELSQSRREELCSIAYMTALAVSARCELMHVHCDIDSVDAVVMPRGGSRLPFGVQLKATTLDCVGADEIIYDLPIKNYHNLRLQQTVLPTLLVLLHLPLSESDWVGHDEHSMILRNKAYYLNLIGAPGTINTTTKRIRIPAGNRLTTDALNSILAFYTASKTLPT